MLGAFLQNRKTLPIAVQVYIAISTGWTKHASLYRYYVYQSIMTITVDSYDFT